MLLSFIYSPSKLYHKPVLLFFEAIFLTVISFLLSLFIFPKDYLSFGILMFLTIGSIPIFTKLFSYNSYLSNYQKPFFKRHSSLLGALGYFFLGVFVTYVVFFFLFSINYNLETYNIHDKIVLETETNTNTFFYELVETNNNSLKVYLYQNNQPIKQGTFSVGEYISFKGYEFNKTYLITDLDNEIVLSIGNGLRENIFFVQLKEQAGIATARSSLTGQIINTQKDSKFSQAFSLIFNNNFNVIIKATLMSFFYGAGALFLISWNASVLASVVASSIFVSMAPVISQGIKGFFIGIFHSLYLFLGYLPHGLPELLAYFLVSFAGAMFIRDLLKGLFKTEFKYKILKDLLFIFLLAFILLFLGALIEASYFIGF
jgi:hypothetical protein